MKFLHSGILAIIYFSLTAPLSCALSWSGLPAQDTGVYVSPFYEDNERCFKCHGQEKYEYANDIDYEEIMKCIAEIIKEIVPVAV